MARCLPPYASAASQHRWRRRSVELAHPDLAWRRLASPSVARHRFRCSRGSCRSYRSPHQSRHHPDRRMPRRPAVHHCLRSRWQLPHMPAATQAHRAHQAVPGRRAGLARLAGRQLPSRPLGPVLLAAQLAPVDRRPRAVRSCPGDPACRPCPVGPSARSGRAAPGVPAPQLAPAGPVHPSLRLGRSLPVAPVDPRVPSVPACSTRPRGRLRSIHQRGLRTQERFETLVEICRPIVTAHNPGISCQRWYRTRTQTDRHREHEREQGPPGESAHAPLVHRPKSQSCDCAARWTSFSHRPQGPLGHRSPLRPARWGRG